MPRHLLVLLALLPLMPSTVCAQDSGAEPPAPWDLTRLREGEPVFAPTLRTRAAEETYRDHPQWRTVYPQLRAFAEVAVGNHAAALKWFDAPSSAPDSVGVLPGGLRAMSALDYLAAATDTVQVIMVNERHHAASDRLLTLELLPILHEKGFRYLAAEAFSHTDTLLAERGYPIASTGTYTGEMVFSEIVREALRLGFALVAYEVTQEQANVEDERSPQQRRDEAQADNLIETIFRDDPHARVLVHAGFSHILESATERWYPMALYFREKTGIDPLTVDQTRLSERSEPKWEHPSYRAALRDGLLDTESVVLLDASGDRFNPSSFAVDVQVLGPRTAWFQGRPAWMEMEGRREPVTIETPECRNRYCYVEALRADQPAEANPVDVAECSESDSVTLFLPAEVRIEIRLLAEDGELLARRFR